MTDLNGRFDSLTQLINDNHVETVQRLTRVETQVSGLPERVTALEHMKFKLLGMAAAVAFFFTGILEALRLRSHS